MQTNIYALFDPREPDKIRYVGKTRNSVGGRLRLHISKSRRGKTHSATWIRKLLRDGVRPQAELLGSFTGSGDSEEIQMIAFCRMMGIDLTNHTKGGDRWALGFKHSEEARHKMRLAKLGTKQSEEHKKNKTSPEISARISATLKGRKLSDEHKTKIMEGMRRAANRRLLNKMPSSKRY